MTYRDFAVLLAVFACAAPLGDGRPAVLYAVVPVRLADDLAADVGALPAAVNKRNLDLVGTSGAYGGGWGKRAAGGWLPDALATYSAAKRSLDMIDAGPSWTKRSLDMVNGGASQSWGKRSLDMVNAGGAMSTWG